MVSEAHSPEVGLRAILDAAVQALADDGWEVARWPSTMLVVEGPDRRTAQSRCTQVARLLAHAFGGHDSRTSRLSGSSDGRYTTRISYRGGDACPLWTLEMGNDGDWLGTIHAKHVARGLVTQHEVAVPVAI